jgi:serine O-acetyltransferase
MSFKELWFTWYADLYRYEGRAGAAIFLKHMLLSPGYTFTFYLRLCAYLCGKQPAILATPLYWLARIILRHYTYKFGIFIPYDTQIDAGFYIGHCGDIHVNSCARIGRNCNISQGVTLGQANRGKNAGYPIVGDDVYIGPGAKIIGAVRVGNNVAIGANCVVTKDVPDHAVVVGVPGRVISYDGAAGYVEHTEYATYRGRYARSSPEPHP